MCKGGWHGFAVTEGLFLLSFWIICKSAVLHRQSPDDIAALDRHPLGTAVAGPHKGAFVLADDYDYGDEDEEDADDESGTE